MVGTDDNTSNSIAIDDSGNVYTTGYFEGTTDFDPGPSTFNMTASGSVNSVDMFISKLDAAGNFVWAKQMAGYYAARGYSIAVDDSGNVYTTGPFLGTVDFDPGSGIFNMTYYGGSDIFISKLDVDGNFIWAKQIGSTSTDISFSIVIDGTGNVYTTGYFTGTVDFDPGPGIFNMINPGTGQSVFISKLDAAGNFIWAKQFVGTHITLGYSLIMDVIGNIYTTGYFYGTVDFDPGVDTFNISSNGGMDVFISKLDTVGNFVWAKQIGGTDYDYCYSIALDDFGYLYTTGYFTGTADFDPGSSTFNMTSNGTEDIFISKLDIAGNFVWARQIGGIDSDIGYSIAIDDSGYVYTTGFFSKTVDFDPETGMYYMNAGIYNAFISKLNSKGNFVWGKQMKGKQVTGYYGTSQSKSIAIDHSGSIFTTGNFNGTVDFNPGIGTFDMSTTLSGSKDVFVSKLLQCNPNGSTDIQSACDSFTWLDGVTYTISNNMATHVLTNISGCDSVVTLDLTVVTVDTSVNQDGANLSSNMYAAAYQWLDCDNNFAIIQGAINQNFSVTSNGNYAVEITQNNCIDTSNCYSITNYGIVVNDFGDGLLLYPNPTKGNFFVDLGNSNNLTIITITDSKGKTVKINRYNKKQLLNIELEEPAGVYFLIIESDNKRAIIQILKE